MGVTCETMSLQLLTAQAKLVEALAGMYMKSTIFRADEGLGELSLPGAPQVGLVLQKVFFFFFKTISRSDGTYPHWRRGIRRGFITGCCLGGGGGVGEGAGGFSTPQGDGRSPLRLIRLLDATGSLLWLYIVHILRTISITKTSRPFCRWSGLCLRRG